MLPPPDKHTLELEVDGFFTNGDKSNVARLVQKDSSTVSRQLSPNNEHNNHIVYTFLLFVWAFDMIRRDLGDKVINCVLRERAKWNGEAIEVTEHPAKLTGNVGHQYTEAVEAEIGGHSLDDQISEWGDVVSAAAKKQKALIDQRASAFRPHIANETREFARAAVAKRNGGRK